MADRKQDEKVEEIVQDAHNRCNFDVSEEQYVVSDLPPMQDDDLIFEMYYLQCLAQGSYLIASKSEGNAYIVDPRRDVDFYVSRLKCMSETHKVKLNLKGILMTHAHADFVAGNVELADRVNTDNKLDSKDKNACHSYFGDQVGTAVKHIAVNDKTDPFYISKTYQIRPLHTPGHTLGCITWILDKKDEKSNKFVPFKAFTGDTLFIGSVGRPDLVSAPKDSQIKKDANEMRKLMAGKMYQTLTTKIFGEKTGLPDTTHVHPAHGAGSPCGANLSDAMWSTIENERKTNIAFEKTKEGEEKFISWLVGSSKDIEQGTPQYFEACVRANMTGVTDVGTAIKTIHENYFYTAKQFDQAIKSANKKIDTNGPVFIIDTRESDIYSNGHIPKSLNFPIGPQKGTVLRKIDGNFAIWLGTLIPNKCQLFIVACEGSNNKDDNSVNGGCKIDDAIVRFTRINYDSCIKGILKGGFNEWIDNKLPITKIERFTLKNMNIKDANEKLLNQGKNSIFLDVRTKHEYDESHVSFKNIKNNNGLVHDEAINFTLSVDMFDIDKLKQGGLKQDCQYIAYCSAGFRSTIAGGILRSMGFNVKDVLGGYDLGLAPWIDQKTLLSGQHGLCKMSQKWALKLGFEIPSLLAQIKK